jgi:hypothetical protein
MKCLVALGPAGSFRCDRILVEELLTEPLGEHAQDLDRIMLLHRLGTHDNQAVAAAAGAGW